MKSSVGKSNALKGMKFVVTGELSRWSRREIEEFIESLGGKVSSSVSKNTDYLIVGKKPGSKLKKAKELGVKTITEDEFIDLVKKLAKDAKIPDAEGPMTLF